MCGIVGIYLKNPELRPRLGEIFSPMLMEMDRPRSRQLRSGGVPGGRCGAVGQGHRLRPRGGLRLGWRRGAGGGLDRDGPLILDEGYGVYVKDLEGNEYI